MNIEEKEELNKIMTNELERFIDNAGETIREREIAERFTNGILKEVAGSVKIIKRGNLKEEEIKKLIELQLKVILHAETMMTKLEMRFIREDTFSELSKYLIKEGLDVKN